MNVGFVQERYTAALRAWLNKAGHYLNNAPPGALFCVTVRAMVSGLLGPEPGGELLGICVVGRPIARRLPQDGSVGEVVRMWLAPGLPHGTASALLRESADIARARGMTSLIAYHDRTRHTGCIYRKAGFRRDGVTHPPANGWATRGGRASSGYETTPKRRWRLTL